MSGSSRVARLAPLWAWLGSACTPPDPGAVSECPPPDRARCPAASTEPFVDPLRHVGVAESSTFIEISDLLANDDLVFACTGVRGLVIWDAGGDEPGMLVENVRPPAHAHGTFPRCQHVGLDREARRVVFTNRGDEVQPVPWVAVADVTDPRAPSIVAQWSDPSVSVEGAVIDGDRVIVAGHTSGIQVLALEGTMLSPTGSFSDEQSDAWQVVALPDDPDILVTAEGQTGLRTYRLEDAGPELLATVELEGSSRDLILTGDAGRTAIVAASSSLSIVDLTDPAAPVLRSTTPTTGTALALAAIDSSTVAVAEWDEVRGYDVSDPTAVREVFAERLPAPAAFSRVLAVDADPGTRRVFAGEWHGMHVLAHDPNGTGPDLTVAPQALQFGQVPPGQSDDAVLVLRNDGDLGLTVHEIVTADGVSVDQSCLQIPAGSAAAVEVTVAPPSDTELRTAVRVCSDDPDEPQRDVGLSVNIEGLDVGDPAPEFSLRDLTGRTWSTADLEGNVAVLAYFATF